MGPVYWFLSQGLNGKEPVVVVRNNRNGTAFVNRSTQSIEGNTQGAKVVGGSGLKVT